MEKVIAEGGRRGGPGRGNSKRQAPGWHFWGDSPCDWDGRGRERGRGEAREDREQGRWAVKAIEGLGFDSEHNGSCWSVGAG